MIRCLLVLLALLGPGCTIEVSLDPGTGADDGPGQVTPDAWPLDAGGRDAVPRDAVPPAEDAVVPDDAVPLPDAGLTTVDAG